MPEEEFFTYLYDNYVSPLGSPADERLKAKDVQTLAVKGINQRAQVSTDDVGRLSAPSPLDSSSHKEEKSEIRKVPTKAGFIQIYEKQEAFFMKEYKMEEITGVKSILEYLKHVASVPIALATNSRRVDLMQKFLESKVVAIQAIRDYFVDQVEGAPQSGDEARSAQGDGKRRWVCLDDVSGRGKPEPEIYFEAARMLGVSKDQYKSCLVFEDSWTGVQVQGQ